MKVRIQEQFARDFDPITVTITIESLAELQSLTARCNLAPQKVVEETAKWTFGKRRGELCRVSELYSVLNTHLQEVLS